MRLHDPVLAVGARFHETESLPATSLIDANFEAISAELLGHVDRGRSGFRNAYDNAWMPTGEHWMAINLSGLADAGSTIDRQDNYGNTALFNAAAEGRPAPEEVLNLAP
jgi:hypothetical protein